jgi:arabinan endo-1,5-alpha-L-arabinosidase
MKLQDIHLRDPFVVPVPEERRYYLYGTTRMLTEGTGFDTYVSADLENWEGPFEVFAPPLGFYADRDFWAAEVHRYQGRYYMFASFKAERVCRGTAILAADSPRGPFLPHSTGPVTPREWECLDGTLFVDESGAPWIVFCHEWVQVHDGEICAQRLNADLRQIIGEPLLLFRASEAPWVLSYRPGRGEMVTDGPCLYRASDGALFMVWSSFGKGGYSVGVARSASGQIQGPWVQRAEPIYAEDGGHGAVFRTFEGQLMLELHHPNKPPLERPRLLPISESDLLPK